MWMGDRMLRKDSRLVLALDEIERARAVEVAMEVADVVDAVKINWPLVLHTSPDMITTLSELAPVICDFKVADIPNTNELIVRRAVALGASAVIVHGFPGRDSVSAAIRAAGEADVFVVTEMSHPGGEEYTAPVADRLARMARELGASGVIAPATRPSRLVEIRRIVGDMLILAPGVGAQGGSAAGAIESGADYVIVGRAIYRSADPRRAAKAIVREMSPSS